MSESELMADRLYEASTRATWYQTGEARLLTAASVAIRGHDHDVDQAVAIEREATSAFLERVANYATHPMIGEGGEWRRVVSDIELRAIAQAIRNGDHVKEEA